MQDYPPHPPKYHSTGHWRWSPKVHRDDSYHPDPEFFLNKEIIITEKIDGGNTCLYHGDAYARSTDSPAHEGWFSMVKNQHAWKTGIVLVGGDHGFRQRYAYYGEDMYGVHSIEYDAVYPQHTFYLFSVLDLQTMRFVCWDDVDAHGCSLNVLRVPVVHRGTFGSVEGITGLLEAEMKNPSTLGGEREGFVIRLVDSFPYDDIIKVGKTLVMRNVCKYVRPNHVQTDQHWKENWRPCKLKR